MSTSTHDTPWHHRVFEFVGHDEHPVDSYSCGCQWVGNYEVQDCERSLMKSPDDLCVRRYLEEHGVMPGI